MAGFQVTTEATPAHGFLEVVMKLAALKPSPDFDCKLRQIVSPVWVEVRAIQIVDKLLAHQIVQCRCKPEARTNVVLGCLALFHPKCRCGFSGGDGREG